MIVHRASKFTRPSWLAAAALASGICAAPAAFQGAWAQTNPPAAEAPPAPSNPFRALTDRLGFTTEAGEGADFVRQSRPDREKMGYSNLTGVDKPRVPVKTPEQLEADKAALIAEREKVDARRKKLQAEKLDAVAPNRAPPPNDEKF